MQEIEEMEILISKDETLDLLKSDFPLIRKDEAYIELEIKILTNLGENK